MVVERVTGEHSSKPARGQRFSLDRAHLEREVRIETFRASGPGGQHLHKTESAVRLIHPPSGVSVTASDTRSQARNREIAFERLIERLRKLNHVRKPRKKTRPTRSSVERRLTDKRHQSERKRTRASRVDM
jgi:protein subunit release factor B